MYHYLCVCVCVYTFKCKSYIHWYLLFQSRVNMISSACVENCIFSSTMFILSLFVVGHRNAALHDTEVLLSIWNICLNFLSHNALRDPYFRPFLVNELDPQYLLHDRRKVYEVLWHYILRSLNLFLCQTRLADIGFINIYWWDMRILLVQGINSVDVLILGWPEI